MSRNKFQNFPWACQSLPPPPFLMEECCRGSLTDGFHKMCAVVTAQRPAQISNTATSWWRIQSKLPFSLDPITWDRNWFQISMNYTWGNGHLSVKYFPTHGDRLWMSPCYTWAELFLCALLFSPSSCAFRENASGMLSPRFLYPIIIHWILSSYSEAHNILHIIKTFFFFFFEQLPLC